MTSTPDDKLVRDVANEGVVTASSRLNLDELDKMLLEGAGIDEPYEVIAELVARVRELTKTALHFWDERDEARAALSAPDAGADKDEG